MGGLPLDGVLVLEFCQYLSGPFAGLRLADLGARVIKIESTRGDACRKLAIEDLWVGEDSLLFHTINRNKESFTANLKDPDDLKIIYKLVRKADVVIHNFRPGVMEKLALGYETISDIHPKIVYASISGYGTEGPWVKKPGQDLLVQAKSGLMFTSGNRNDPPVPFGLAVADIMCGNHAVQAIIAGLIKKERTGKGSKLELSLLESLIDVQFELFTTYYASGQLPERSETNNGHTLLGAPYGIYQTQDGYVAIAMVALKDLADAIHCQALAGYVQEKAFDKRDEIKEIIASHLKTETSEHWMKQLRSSDLWAMELGDWQKLWDSEGYKSSNMELELDHAEQIKTTRCPIRLDGETLGSPKAAPGLGADNQRLIKEFELA